MPSKAEETVLRTHRLAHQSSDHGPQYLASSSVRHTTHTSSAKRRKLSHATATPYLNKSPRIAVVSDDVSEKSHSLGTSDAVSHFTSQTTTDENTIEAQRILQTRKDLPIWSKRTDIRNALRAQDCLILVGETGSGKSTQAPHFLYTEPWCRRRKISTSGGKEVTVGGMIAVTEPRRIAAQTLSRRTDREMLLSSDNRGKKNPARAGHVVRFASNMPPNTRIKYVTEGTLLQEMVSDPSLRQYSAVVVDEIHERSVDADLVLGFLRMILHSDHAERGGIPLKVIVMSATLDHDSLKGFLSKPEQESETRADTNCSMDPSPATSGRKAAEASLVKTQSPKECAPSKGSDVHLPDSKSHHINTGVEFVKGRQFPVDVYYEATPQHDYLDTMLRKILHVHVTEPLPGDILGFLTGQEEIQALQAQLIQHSSQFARDVPPIQVMPLYGSLPAHEQQAAFERAKGPNTRKIVLATNIAETSVTVLGIRYVIDSGKAKIKQYRSSLGMESLLIKTISRVSAVQRTGRAGREGPGKCWRLYTEKDFAKFEPDEKPEILRTDVVEAVLKMKARGIKDIFAFPLMDSPEVTAMRRALLQLSYLGAVDSQGALTEDGRKIATFPLPAAFGKVLLIAAETGTKCLLEAIDVISIITSETELFFQPKTEEQREDINDLRKELFCREGDLLTYLTTMRRFVAEVSGHKDWCWQRFISLSALKNALSVRKQLHRVCLAQKMLSEAPPVDPQPFEPSSPESAEVLCKAFLKAFIGKTATLGREGKYITTYGRHAITIHPSSVLYGRKLEAIMFLEHVFTSKSYAKIVTAVQANWISEVMFA